MGASHAILGVLTPHPWTQPEAPVNDLNRLARAMQDLLTGTADRLAREAGFVRRQRKVTGANFAQALVFSFLGDSKAPA